MPVAARMATTVAASTGKRRRPCAPDARPSLSTVTRGTTLPPTAGWWISPHHLGIDQGPIVLAIENYRTGLLWNIMRRCSPIVAGLRRAGFSGGWLSRQLD